MPTERALWKQDRNVSGTLAEGGRRPSVAVAIFLEYLIGHLPMAETMNTWPTGALEGAGQELVSTRSVFWSISKWCPV